jgi:hypothetical protein
MVSRGKTVLVSISPSLNPHIKAQMAVAMILSASRSLKTDLS